MSTGTAPSSRLSPLATILLALSAVWCVLWFAHAMHYWEDDAYIHLEFARSLANGQGFSFNGHVVYGDTSPLWVYLLAAFHAVIPTWMTAGKLLVACGVVFACTGAFFYARKLTGDALFAAAMVLLFVVNPYFNYWAFSGMETITAAGLAMWGATIVCDRQIGWTAFFAGCLIAGLGPIARPEMVFLSAILGVVLIYRWFHIPGTLASKLPGLVVGLVLAAGPTVAWSIYALHAFGRLVPNTNAAKRAGPHDAPVLIRLVSVYGLGFPVILVGVLAGLIYVAWLLTRKSDKPALESLKASCSQLPAGGWVFIVWSAIAGFFYIVNHTYVQTRYVFVTASGLTITILAIVLLSVPRWFRTAWVLTGALAAAVSLVATWPFIHNKSEADEIEHQAALWVKSNVPPDAPVAIYSIGEMAYVSEHPIIDTGGITRPGVIPYLYNPAAAQRWTRAEGAQYQFSGDQPEPGATLVYSAEEPTKGWFLNPKQYRTRGTFRLWKLPAQ